MKQSTILVFFVFTCISFSQTVWQELPSHPQGGGVTALETSDAGDIFATTGSFDYPQVLGGISRSTDGGNNWQNLFPVYTARTVDIAEDGTIYASIWDYPNSNEGIYKSTDNGDTWQMVFDVGTNNNVFCIESGMGGYYAGTRTGVLYSADGNSWAYDASFPSGSGWVRDIEMREDGTPVAASYGGVYYKSVINWLQVPGVNPGDTVIVVGIGGNGFQKNISGNDDGLVLGSISGNLYNGTLLSVTLFCALGFEIAGFILEEGNNFAGVYSPVSKAGGVYELPSGSPINEGLPTNRPLSALDDTETRSTIRAIAGFYYNTADGAKIYTRDFVTTVESNNSEIPNTFKLEQNYPNPFNPSTNIEYSIPEASFVELKVYDVLGNDVATLVSEEKSAGVYMVNFSADNLAGGIYFYTFNSGRFNVTRKMILLK